MRGRTKRKSTNEPQDLDPICSPHLEERLIGENVDLDLLFQIPQKDARIIGGIEREQAFLKVSNGGERGEKRANSAGGRGRVFIPLQEI